MRRPLTISVFETSVDLDKRVLRQPRFGGIGVCKRERSKSTKNTEVCCAAKSRCGCRMQLYFFFFFFKIAREFFIIYFAKMTLDKLLLLLLLLMMEKLSERQRERDRYSIDRERKVQ